MGESGPPKLNWSRLLLCGVVLSTIIVAAMFCYAYSSARITYSVDVCRMTMLSRIAQSIESYAVCENGWPDSCDQLARARSGRTFLREPAICPAARAKGLPEPHYAIAPGLKNGMPDSHILVYELHHVHGGKRHVCFVGGKAELWGHDRDAELERHLEAQRRAAKPSPER